MYTKVNTRTIALNTRVEKEYFGIHGSYTDNPLK